MARSSYYSIVIRDTDEDISGDVTDLSHELATDVDNLLTLTFKNKDIHYFDRKNIIEGTILIFQYGYIGGSLSPKYLARVVDITNQYMDHIQTKLIATDLGILLKKNESKKVYEGKTVSEVVQEIADLNGLVAVVDPTEVVHDFLPQGGKTDYEFLKYLSTIETDGSYRFYLKDNTIVFTKRDLDKTSIRTFTYGSPDNEIKSFRPSSYETRKTGASRNTVVDYVDPVTGEVIHESVSNTNSKDDTKLGDYVIHFNENGEEISRIPSKTQELQEDENRVGQFLNQPVISDTEAQNLANKEKKDSALEDYTAELILEGNPSYVEDEIITLANVSKKDLGNWYVKRAMHSISSGGGYETRLALLRNASRKSSNTDDTKQDNVNNTSGNEAGNIKRKIKVKLFDENSNLVGEKLK